MHLRTNDAFLVLDQMRRGLDQLQKLHIKILLRNMYKLTVLIKKITSWQQRFMHIGKEVIGEVVTSFTIHSFPIGK